MSRFVNVGMKSHDLNTELNSPFVCLKLQSAPTQSPSSHSLSDVCSPQDTETEMTLSIKESQQCFFFTKEFCKTAYIYISHYYFLNPLSSSELYSTFQLTFSVLWPASLLWFCLNGFMVSYLVMAVSFFFFMNSLWQSLMLPAQLQTALSWWARLLPQRFGGDQKKN